jgi:hypothetical protein
MTIQPALLYYSNLKIMIKLKGVVMLSLSLYNIFKLNF